MSVHEIKPAPYRDLTKVMRKIADAIDAGEYGEVQGIAAVLMRPGGQPPEVFSWGQLSDLETLGAFALAHHWILRHA